MDILLGKGLRVPIVYSPEVNGLTAVTFDLDNAASGYFIPWEIRAFAALPEVSVVATKVISKNERGGNRDRMSDFYFPKTIIIPACKNAVRENEFISPYQLRVLVSGNIKPGSYYMHFTANYIKKDNVCSYNFSQKIILTKKN